LIVAEAVGVSNLGTSQRRTGLIKPVKHKLRLMCPCGSRQRSFFWMDNQSIHLGKDASIVSFKRFPGYLFDDSRGRSASQCRTRPVKPGAPIQLMCP